MALFKKKQSANPLSEEEIVEAEINYFDEVFREELRNHGRWFFEKIITENGEKFKQDLETTIIGIKEDLNRQVSDKLDATIEDINSELKNHVAKQLDEQFLSYGKTLKDAQEITTNSLKRSAEMMEQQHQELQEVMKRSAADQQAMLNEVSGENKAWIDEMKQAQSEALEWLNNSSKAMQEQHDKLLAELDKHVADQQQQLIKLYEENMAQINERYLIEALGDQYDLKEQVPAIIKQMEENKQAIVDDMKL